MREKRNDNEIANTVFPFEKSLVRTHVGLFPI